MSIRTGGAGIPFSFLWPRCRVRRLPGLLPIVAAGTARGCAGVMEDRRIEEHHVHYNHTDPCSHLRWTARECYEFMYERPWQRVSNFFADVVCGKSSLRSLFPGVPTADGSVGDTDTVSADFASRKERTGRWVRSTFKIDLGYHGGSFEGWQKQPDLNTVQGVVEMALGEFVDEKKAQQLKDRSLPVEGCASVAGRTDKGVSALHQVCSFYTWNKSVKACDIKDAINRAAPGKLRALSVAEVSRVFHPNFSAKWRRYFYIFPLDGRCKHQLNNCERSDSAYADEMADNRTKLLTEFDHGNDRYLSASPEGDHEAPVANAVKNDSFSVSRVNQILLQLEGKSLSYKMFARDTKASRSIGPPTECYVFHARAAEARLPCDDQDGEGLRVMCVELVANRFLRRMVRVLVATSIREAAAGNGDDALLKLMDATCRRATAPPAPPEGLCLADVGYEEFSRERCLIS
ncbi:unnamed protein product [Spirodela intermedia]|uniref:tRNA pseudouridine synthase n=1 Tax=Spirodela intermedia TaxID=51605 RepID=A0A7I8KLW7_SPIIN|nr:unnamed protein product [Spirodela intermedia]